MKKAYVIGNITVKDIEKWDEYRSKVPDTLSSWGANLVFRGKLNSILTGNQNHNDTVVICFPNLQSVNDWYTSSQYQALIPLREKAADIDLLVYEE